MLSLVLRTFSTVRPEASGTFSDMSSGLSPRFLHQLRIVRGKRAGERWKKRAAGALDLKKVHVQPIVLVVEA